MCPFKRIPNHNPVVGVIADVREVRRVAGLHREDATQCVRQVFDQIQSEHAIQRNPLQRAFMTMRKRRLIVAIGREHEQQNPAVRAGVDVMNPAQLEVFDL